jgi:hypothetical protein
MASTPTGFAGYRNSPFKEGTSALTDLIAKPPSVKLKPITRLNAHAMPDISRNGDLAFAGQGCGRHGVATAIDVPYCKVGRTIDQANLKKSLHPQLLNPPAFRQPCIDPARSLAASGPG